MNFRPNVGHVAAVLALCRSVRVFPINPEDPFSFGLHFVVIGEIELAITDQPAPVALEFDRLKAQEKSQ
jgi:hypothetical protein